MRLKPSLDTTEKGLEQAEKGLNWASGKLGVAAWTAAIATAVIAFLIVQFFAIFPYIELKHTAIVGALVSLGLGGWVYLFVSRPADLVGKASWGVWAAKHGVRLGKQALAKDETVASVPGEAAAGTGDATPGVTTGGASPTSADTGKKE